MAKTSPNPTSSTALKKGPLVTSQLALAISSIGLVVGEGVGRMLGLAVGPSVGRTVGLVVGSEVGRVVGVSVGCGGVGVVTGARVGAKVVGAIVGEMVGLVVGSSVGTAVNKAVGRIVCKEFAVGEVVTTMDAVGVKVIWGTMEGEVVGGKMVGEGMSVGKS